MTTKSFVSKLVSKGSVPIYLVTGADANDLDFFAYLISTPEKMRMYEVARTKGRVNLHDYGQVIASGFGKIPDSATKKMLHESYGLPVED